MLKRTRPSQSAEDYLKRIHELIERKGYARVVDIASSLKVKQASVLADLTTFFAANADALQAFQQSRKCGKRGSA